MRILGIKFGKKDKNGDNNDHFITKPGDKKIRTDKSSSKIEQDPDDITKDSLRICYKPYSRYRNFVEQIMDKEWHYVGDMQTYSLNSLSSYIVSTYYVEKNMYGTFLEITCPSPLYKITICGFDDAGIDPIEFYSHSNLYKIPHFFSITCTDNSGKELSPDVTIDITQTKQNGESKKLCSEPYGDLSQHIDGRFRRKEERYFFYASVKLEDHEKLSFRVNYPDIDIMKTQLSMKADLFAKDDIDKT